MPELPEVESVRRSLVPSLTGKQFTDFELFWRKTLDYPSLTAFKSAMIGNRISRVDRRGKLVVLLLQSTDRITVHLRMTGVLQYFEPSSCRALESDPQYLRALFEFADGSSLGFFDVRKFGRIQFLQPANWEKLDQELGVEPLDLQFTATLLATILAQRKRQIKPLLLDQRLIAGLGNIYVDEALFSAGIHPQASSNRIASEKVAALHQAIVEILGKAIDNGGTTLRDYRDGLGAAGTNQLTLRIYGRPEGDPCPSCATPVRRIKVGQRGTVFCPVCQPLDPNLQ